MTETNQATTHAGIAGVGFPDLSSVGRQMLQYVKRGWDGYVARRSEYLAVQALSRLDDRMLRDMGIARSEIVSAVKYGRHGHHACP